MNSIKQVTTEESDVEAKFLGNEEYNASRSQIIETLVNDEGIDLDNLTIISGPFNSDCVIKSTKFSVWLYEQEGLQCDLTVVYNGKSLTVQNKGLSDVIKYLRVALKPEESENSFGLIVDFLGEKSYGDRSLKGFIKFSWNRAKGNLFPFFYGLSTGIAIGIIFSR